MELAAYATARECGQKVLGVCRGIQLLAVSSGGSLFQHLPADGYDGHWDYVHEYEPSHVVNVDAGTLAERAAAGASKLNSIHHQGVRFFFSSRRRHTRWTGDWSSDVCSSD